MDGRFITGLAKDWLMALVVVVVAVGVFNTIFGSKPLQTGSAPAFSLEDLDGNIVQLSDFDEDLVVLNFWFTSCSACRIEIPHLSSFQEKYPDTVLYGVNVDDFDAKRLKRLSEQLRVDYPVLRDVGAVTAEDYQVSMFPTTFIVLNGDIVSASQGVLTLEGLEAEIARVRGS
jgi:thiol-disulfide isomerase/thioredoxin